MKNPFKRKKKTQPQQMDCPKCGETMTLTSGLTYTFHCKDREVEVHNITGMKCAGCGEVMFDWNEAQRIEKYVHEAVGWEDEAE